MGLIKGNWSVVNGVYQNSAIQYGSITLLPIFVGMDSHRQTQWFAVHARMLNPYGASGNRMGFVYMYEGDGSGSASYEEIVFGADGIARVNHVSTSVGPDGKTNVTVIPRERAPYPWARNQWFDVTFTGSHLVSSGSSLDHVFDVSVNGTPVFTSLEARDLTGRIGLVTNYTPGRFDDVWFCHDGCGGGVSTETFEDDNGWFALRGTWDTEGDVLNNRTAGANDIVYTTREAGSTNYTLSARMLNPYGASGNRVGLIFDFDFVGGDYYEVEFAPTGQAYLNKFIQGQLTQVATAAHSALGRNVWFNVELARQGPNATVKVNNQIVFENVPAGSAGQFTGRQGRSDIALGAGSLRRSEIRGLCASGSKIPPVFIVFDRDRASDSPLIERVWSCHSIDAGIFLSVASSHWEIVVTRLRGECIVTVRGPETKASEVHCPADGEWFAIRFAAGTFMPRLPVGQLLNGKDVNLPQADRRRFWLNGAKWEFPDFENAEDFVARLANERLIVRDPDVAAALRGEQHALSTRSAERHFLRATGMTHGAMRQIERARNATNLLRQGFAITDVVHQAGYFDQAHLTRSLRKLVGLDSGEDRGRRAAVVVSVQYDACGLTLHSALCNAERLHASRRSEVAHHRVGDERTRNRVHADGRDHEITRAALCARGGECARTSRRRHGARARDPAVDMCCALCRTPNERARGHIGDGLPRRRSRDAPTCWHSAVLPHSVRRVCGRADVGGVVPSRCRGSAAPQNTLRLYSAAPPSQNVMFDPQGMPTRRRWFAREMEWLAKMSWATPLSITLEPARV